MSYFVKSIQYTLQGEGYWSGRGAVFLRFAGCNLWSGREQDRAKGAGSCSRWCDTDFVGVDGPGGGKLDNAEDLAEAVLERWNKATKASPRPFVVITGGEPLLQVDSVLTKALRAEGFYIAIETNGTIAPEWVWRELDWVCVSPKEGAEIVLKAADEVKVVFPQDGLDLAELRNMMDADHWWISPMDPQHNVDDRTKNIRLATEFCLKNPQWRLSLQLHKQAGIP